MIRDDALQATPQRPVVTQPQRRITCPVDATPLEPATTNRP
jgi:hypothetical protein